MNWIGFCACTIAKRKYLWNFVGKSKYCINQIINGKNAINCQIGKVAKAKWPNKYQTYLYYVIQNGGHIQISSFLKVLKLQKNCFKTKEMQRNIYLFKLKH